jgi:hypothetical protein
MAADRRKVLAGRRPSESKGRQWVLMGTGEARRSSVLWTTQPQCVVASVEFQYKQLALDGTVLVYTATVSFEEILDARVTSEEQRAGRGA